MSWTGHVLRISQAQRRIVWLALLYAYRLKFQNPALSGEPGSEYKVSATLLVIAHRRIRQIRTRLCSSLHH